MSREAPLAHVRRLSERTATGELICAVGDLEVHVYLQEGRIAWATSSAARFAFSRDLVRRCGVDPEALRELVEDCRRTRRALGETLISWGLASREDVRESLRMQILGALETLLDRPGAPTLFLERGERYLAYDRQLTFSLDELLESSIDRTDGGSHTVLVERLLGELPELRWAEVLRGGEIVCARPDATAPRRSTRRVAEVAFGDGAVDVVAVRAGLGTMVGVARGDGTSIWLGLGREARLGSVFAALSDLLRHPSPDDLGMAGPVKTTGARCDDCVPVLEDVLARWTEADAACVLRPRAEATVVHRPSVDPASIRDLAATQTPILWIDEVSQDTHEPGETDLQAFAESARSLVVGRGARWHLGAPVPDGSGRVLWIAVSRHAPQGLAWALLGATARQLAHVSCGAARQ